MSDFRYEHVRQRLLLADLGYRSAVPLAALVESTEALQYMPLMLRSLPLSSVLMLSAQDVLALPGVGRTKLERLAACLELVANDALGESDGDELEDLVHDEDTEPVAAHSGSAWRQTAVVAERGTADPASLKKVVGCLGELGLLQQPVGRALPSLRRCPRCIRELTFRELLEQEPVSVIVETPGVRYRAVADLLSVVPDLAERARRIGVTVDFTAERVAKARNAVRALLNERKIPSVAHFRTQVVKPLLEQVEHDGGETCAEVARCRLGLRHVERKYSAIADHVALSTARVQQLVARAHRILAIRWREGEYLLDDLCDLLQRDLDSYLVFQLCWQIFALFYPERLAYKAASTKFWLHSAAGIESPAPAQSPHVSARGRDITAAGGGLQAPHATPHLSDLHPEIRRLLGT